MRRIIIVLIPLFIFVSGVAAQDIPGWHLFVNRMLRCGMKVVVNGEGKGYVMSLLNAIITKDSKTINVIPASEWLCDKGTYRK